MASDQPHTYKFLYMKGIRGRMEATRMMLEMAGAPYELESVTFREWSAKHKAGK